MSDPPPKWQKRTLKLPENHGWVAKPGYNVFVADRGAVRFDYPHDWVVLPGKDSIKFHDRQPPDDECVLQVSVIRLPPLKGGWGGLPLERLVRETLRGDKRGVTGGEKIVVEDRPELELAWSEVNFIDPIEKRPARSRCCMARANNIQPLITMDFWETDAEKFGPVWDEVLRSLQIGIEVKDPTRRNLN